jgi:hypothetical protein
MFRFLDEMFEKRFLQTCIRLKREYHKCEIQDGGSNYATI